ncbi:hypothetical protein [Sphingomonas sp.]|uniref:hypothetical protein n=1 Tax=Sphingomonas sp. TaxID=28214 RepID=UPI00286A9E9F|nr:hypothetical protein [Sphingomonas sp.]
MTPAEKAWIHGALQASDDVMEQRLHLADDPRPTIIVFNKICRFEADGKRPQRWVGTAHQGKIHLPDGSDLDVGVTSFASQDDKSGARYFVMALPAVWEAAKMAIVSDHGLTGVFLHEFSHTRQMNALKPVFAAASAQYKMADDFNDDSLQKHFQTDPAYAAVIEKETSLLYRAAGEPDSATAKALAGQALSLMEARQKRWFIGEEAMWKPYDDLFLTMEGFGQWSAYAWLSDPRGGAMSTVAAETKMRGSRKWWSQEEGLGLFLVIDRFVPNWASQAFAAPPVLGIDLLRQATAKKTSPSGA